MKRLAIILAILVLITATAWTAIQRSRMRHPFSGQEITIPGRDGDGVLLPDGWKVTPAGRQLESGDMILSAQVSPDGTLLAFTNSGYTRHQFHIVDLATEKEIATFPLDRAWSGLAWSPNGKRVLISAGAGNAAADIYTFQRWDDGTWTQRQSVRLEGIARAEKGDKGGKNDGPKSAVSSIVVSSDGKFVYGINDSDGNLYILDGGSGKTISKLSLGDHPYVGKLSRDGKALYVSLIGAAEVAKVDVSDPFAPKVANRIAVEPHPNDLAITADDRLFVSCGNTNHVLAIDLRNDARMEAVSVAPTPKAPVGSTPVSLALSPDGKKLFVADADNNSVAVIDISQRGTSRIAGFIPTGWYPTAVAVTLDGKRVLIGSGKGLGTGPNHAIRPETKDGVPAFVHHGNNLRGLISFVDMPADDKLAEYTRQVYQNSPYRDEMLVKAEIKGNSVIPSEVGKGSPIKHVLYIIKENRTYDQVFGDIAKGNGDPSLVLFGRDVSPNHHAIAEQFVLLDNLYCNGEVSQDGHPWSTAAYATEFNQRAWMLSYSNHGSVNDRKTEEQTHPYIWEAAMEKGLTAFSFGYSGRRGLQPIMSKTFGKNDLPDQQSRLRDYTRAEQFVTEFAQMDNENRVPNFMVMGLGEDHTQGTTPGVSTPQAAVASNDLAIGKIVEAVTKSKAWASSAIFIIEDDAQNGPDHIDSHRTVGLVISPYIKRKTVDSTMYTTVSMLRTMELLLGIPPLTQHDAAATAMYASFSNTADLSSYAAIPPKIDLMTKNTVNSYGSAIAAKMDFSDYDRVDEQTLNRILWHSIKGANVPMPPPVRRAFFTIAGVAKPVAVDDDDDDKPAHK
jgi:YVTN family beta-propeller protein